MSVKVKQRIVIQVILIDISTKCMWRQPKFSAFTPFVDFCPFWRLLCIRRFNPIGGLWDKWGSSPSVYGVT